MLDLGYMDEEGLLEGGFVEAVLTSIHYPKDRNIKSFHNT